MSSEIKEETKTEEKQPVAAVPTPYISNSMKKY